MFKIAVVCVNGVLDDLEPGPPPVRYRTRAEAEAEIEDLVSAQAHAFACGYVEEPLTRADLEIIET